MREQVDDAMQLMKETAGRAQAGVAIGVVMVVVGSTSHDELVLMRWAGIGTMLLCLYVLLLIRLRQDDRERDKDLREQNEHLAQLIKRTAHHVRESGAEVSELRTVVQRMADGGGYADIRHWLAEPHDEN